MLNRSDEYMGQAACASVSKKLPAVLILSQAVAFHALWLPHSRVTHLPYT